MQKRQMGSPVYTVHQYDSVMGLILMGRKNGMVKGGSHFNE